jgi:hypothetical protein
MKKRISQSHEIFVKNFQNWHAAISIYIVLVEESHIIGWRKSYHIIVLVEENSMFPKSRNMDLYSGFSASKCIVYVKMQGSRLGASNAIVYTDPADLPGCF